MPGPATPIGQCPFSSSAQSHDFWPVLSFPNALTPASLPTGIRPSCLQAERPPVDSGFLCITQELNNTDAVRSLCDALEDQADHMRLINRWAEVLAERGDKVFLLGRWVVVGVLANLRRGRPTFRRRVWLHHRAFRLRGVSERSSPRSAYSSSPVLSAGSASTVSGCSTSCWPRSARTRDGSPRGAAGAPRIRSTYAPARAQVPWLSKP